MENVARLDIAKRTTRIITKSLVRLEVYCVVVEANLAKVVATKVEVIEDIRIRIVRINQNLKKTLLLVELSKETKDNSNRKSKVLVSKGLMS